MSNLWQRVCFCRAHAARARCCHLPQEAALEWKMGFGQYADEPQYLTALLSCQVLCYFWINKKEKNNRWTVILFWFANNGFHLWNYLHGCSERLPQNLTDYKCVCTRNALTYVCPFGPQGLDLPIKELWSSLTYVSTENSELSIKTT